MAGLTDISVSNYMDLKIGEVVITDIESFSGISEETNVVEVKQYNRATPRKLVGSKSGAALELTCTLNPSTASHKALFAAKKSFEPQDVEVKYYQDANKAEFITRTFTALVTGYSESSEYDAQRTCTWAISVDSDIVYSEDTSALKAKTK